jgi:microcystin degradation protein MlrC
MRKILVAGCEQEISSFNPMPSQYQDFSILRGAEIFNANAAADTCMRGFLDTFAHRDDIQTVGVYTASACSAGPLSDEGFSRLSSELVDAIRDAMSPEVSAVYLSMHGAMGAVTELDPEGSILEAVRAVVGPDVPIVISLDLHGLLTDKMLRNCDAIAVFHTYPHNDFTSTGQRAGKLMEAILDRGAKPVMARVFIPALVRGPELITATGLYGKLMDRAKELEQSGEVMSAAVMIGNPFTDAPELGSQSLVVTDNDPEKAALLARELAESFWADHEVMVADLASLPEAIAEATALGAPVTFSDAADAPSSGASGDSNAILAALLEAGYPGRVIMPIVDAPAASKAHEAGVGQTITVTLGGSIDPARFPPVEIDVVAERLGNGEYLHEVSRMPAHAGPTAVLRHGNIRIVVVSRAVFMMDRAIYLEHGIDPQDADIIVVKSPGAAMRYFTFAARNYVLDIPGSTSANLKTLGHRVCPRPMFPLDENVVFAPKVQLYPENLGVTV